MVLLLRTLPSDMTALPQTSTAAATYGHRKRVSAIRSIAAAAAATSFVLLVVCVDWSPLPRARVVCATIPFFPPNRLGDGRSGSEPPSLADVIRRAFLIDEDDHPDTHGPAVAEERCAVDPAGTAFAFTVFVGLRKPTDLGGYAAAFAKCFGEIGAHAAAASDAVEEGRLENAGDAKGG
jgi:hypothetical protein